jgi:hypothetical protein
MIVIQRCRFAASCWINVAQLPLWQTLFCGRNKTEILFESASLHNEEAREMLPRTTLPFTALPHNV